MQLFCPVYPPLPELRGLCPAIRLQCNMYMCFAQSCSGCSDCITGAKTCHGPLLPVQCSPNFTGGVCSPRSEGHFYGSLQELCPLDPCLMGLRVSYRAPRASCLWPPLGLLQAQPEVSWRRGVPVCAERCCNQVTSGCCLDSGTGALLLLRAPGR